MTEAKSNYKLKLDELITAKKHGRKPVKTSRKKMCLKHAKARQKVKEYKSIGELKN